MPPMLTVAATILESFIEAQKISVRRALRRGFRKYLANPSDFFSLLLVELQKMVSYIMLEKPQGTKRLAGDGDVPPMRGCVLCSVGNGMS